MNYKPYKEFYKFVNFLQIQKTIDKMVKLWDKFEYSPPFGERKEGKGWLDSKTLPGSIVVR